MAIQFKVPSEFLVTRSQGQELREGLSQRINTAAAGSVVVIDFSAVAAMTGSATDEFLGKFLTTLQAGDVPRVGVLLIGLNEDAAFEVDLCLARRDVAAAAWRDGSVHLLGGDDYLKETFERAARRDEFRASELADELQITPQNVNNRLRRLFTGGALLRGRSDPGAGGKQFVYRVPKAQSHDIERRREQQREAAGHRI